jgi:HPt (histidine-containing phosphotransfer) domain-containing protein
VPEPDTPILDDGALDELMESTGDDIGFVRELIDTFLADTPAQLEAMTAAVEADDAASLVRPAHTLKSSSATVGASRLSLVARELEMAGRTGALEPGVRADLEAAHELSQATTAALAAWLEKASSR